jgi:hypothetical protein
MFLNDERYEDEQGRLVRRHEIDTLGTYKFIGDGFFKWCCGSCGKESETRAYKIGGTVWKCTACGKSNLLVRTDTRFVNQMIAAANRDSTSAEKAITKALVHLGKGIAALGEGR